MGTQRQYDRRFRECAVKLSYERDNIKRLASELGMTAERIYKWRAEFGKHGAAAFQGHGVERLSDEGKRVKELENKLRNTLDKNVVQSMSRRGNCWDNAVAESFFKTLKCELIYGNRYLNPARLELELFEYIEIWYNKIRRHSALKNMTIDDHSDDSTDMAYRDSNVAYSYHSDYRV